MNGNIKHINQGNDYLVRHNFNAALKCYNDEIDISKSPIAYFWKAIALTLIDDTPNKASQNQIQGIIEVIMQNVYTSKTIKEYFLETLYEEPYFDFIMRSPACIDCVCQIFEYDDEIIGAFFSYYLSINIQNLNKQSLYRFENDFCNFCQYISKSDSRFKKTYYKDLVERAKELFNQGKYNVYTIFHGLLYLTDIDMVQYYYYLSILMEFLVDSEPEFLQQRLFEEQQRACQIRKNLMLYRDQFIQTILQFLINEANAGIEHKLNPYQLSRFLTVRIDVVFCVLQFLDGFYTGMEYQIIDLIKILKYYIGRKTIPYHETNVLCKNIDEYRLLLYINNIILQNFGDKTSIPEQQVYFIENNLVQMIPSIEKNIPQMFEYANYYLGKTQ